MFLDSSPSHALEVLRQPMLSQAQRASLVRAPDELDKFIKSFFSSGPKRGIGTFVDWYVEDLRRNQYVANRVVKRLAQALETLIRRAITVLNPSRITKKLNARP